MGHISPSTLKTETSGSPKFKAQVVYIVNPRSARTNTGRKIRGEAGKGFLPDCGPPKGVRTMCWFSILFYWLFRKRG